MNVPHKYYFILFLIGGCFAKINAANISNNYPAKNDTTPSSTQLQAIAYIKTIDTLATSAYWPNIKAASFLENLRLNIYKPLKIYEGISTNFCGYAAISYLLLHDNPLLYAKFMIELYKYGQATMGKAFFHPSTEIKLAVGTLRFKGVLDIRAADQMWFLCLADHFKGYLNVFAGHYHSGDEDKLWASVNYAKFNRMVRTLYNDQVDARGSDMIHPGIPDLYQYIKNRMNSANHLKILLQQKPNNT